MSQSLRDVIPIMGLQKEMREKNFNVLCTKPYVYYCKVFEDKSGALKLARLPKFCPLVFISFSCNYKNASRNDKFQQIESCVFLHRSPY